MATKPETQVTSLPDTSASRTGGDSGTGTGTSTSTTTGTGSTRQRNVRQRKSQFLVAPRRHGALQMMGLAPLNFDIVERALRDAPDIDVIDKIAPRQAVGALGTGLQEGGVLVTLMSDEKASALALQAQGQLIVERDQSLQLLDANYAQPNMVTCNMPVSGNAFTAEFMITGDDGKAVAGAEVYLFGSLLPAQAVSDASGHAKLVLYGESAASRLPNR
jgi:subtilisin